MEKSYVIYIAKKESGFGLITEWVDKHAKKESGFGLITEWVDQET